MVKSARKTNALPLPTGKSHAALADVSIKTIRQFRFNEIEQLRRLAGLAQTDGINFTVLQSKRDVARNGVVNEKNVLWHIADGSLPRRHQRRCQEPAIDQYLACRWLVETKQQINQS